MQLIASPADYLGEQESKICMPKLKADAKPKVDGLCFVDGIILCS